MNKGYYMNDGYGYNYPPNDNIGNQPNRNYNERRNPARFQVGNIVEHVVNGTQLLVIKIGKEQYECRLPNLTSQYFYEHELRFLAKDVESV